MFMDNLQRVRNQEQEVFVAPGQVADEDEISLIDLWRVLARRKRVIAVGLLLGASVAMAFALLVPEKYRFFTTIALGHLTLNNGGEMKILPLDSPQNALAKLQDAYIPKAQVKLIEKNKARETASQESALERADTQACKLVAKIPKDSNLVVIEAKGPEKNELICLGLISDAAQMLIHDHGRVLEPVKARLAAQLEGAKLILETIKDDRIFAVKVNAFEQKISVAKHKLLAFKGQKELLESRYKHIDTEHGLATKALQGNASTLKAALKNRAATIKQKNNPATAVTLLTLGSEIQHYQDRIANLDQRLSINLPEKRETLQKQLETNIRSQQQQADLIAGHEAELAKLNIDRTRQESSQLLSIKGLESRIAEVRPTRILHEASRSIGPVSSGAAVKIALGLMLGLMLGVLGAFVAEFMAKTSTADSS